jgi:hypothetical protein
MPWINTSQMLPVKRTRRSESGSIRLPALIGTKELGDAVVKTVIIVVGKRVGTALR